MAHDIKSPGVSIQVKDQTAFATITQGTVSACVGFAERGPVNEPTLIISKENFKETFGAPLAAQPYMGMFADKFLDISNGYFTRLAKEVDYPSVVGSVNASLNMSGLTTPAFWVELSNFPVPNNGIFLVEINNSNFATLALLVADINAAFAGITLPDGVTDLDSYIEASESDVSIGAKVVISAVSHKSGIITIRAAQADNIAKTSGTGHLGIADGTSSVAGGSYAYSFVRIPVNTTGGTNAAILSAAMVAHDLEKITAFPFFDLHVDGTSGDPYKDYEDLNLTPSTGAPGTFPALLAGSLPAGYPLTLSNTSMTITLGGFYHFQGADATGDVNTAHALTVAAGPHGDMAALIGALNTALSGVTINAGTLDDYIKFKADDVTAAVTTTIGTNTSLFNNGTQCTVELAGVAVPELGYSGTPVDTVGGATTYTADGVAAKIKSLVSEIDSSASAGVVTIESNITGSTSYVKILASTGVAARSALGKVFTFTPDNTVGVNETNDGVINFVAQDAGTWGDSIKTRTYTTVNPVSGETMYFVQVYEDDESVELLGPVSGDGKTMAEFYEDYQEAIEVSKYIALDLGETIDYPESDTCSSGDSDFPQHLPPSSGGSNPSFWQLAYGNNGIADGEEDAMAVLALDDYSDVEQYQIDLLLAPGFISSSVVAKLQSVAELRKDILSIVDSPQQLTYIEAIDWHNGTYSGGSTPLSSAYVVYTWDWQKDFDASNNQYVDLPASIYEAVAIARTQKDYELWEAPAGPERGVVDSISSYSKPSQAQREYLYNDVDPACVNPIVQFPTEGIMIYGQKTCLRVNKAQNRINVTRLVSHVKRNVERIGKTFIFRLSNPSNWADLSRQLSSFLGNIQERGGLTLFTVICDASTNTPERIDQGIMYAKIFIQPTRVAERIFIDLTIQATGAEATV